jgi:membrane-associated phospholipid phosphatase
MDLSNAVTPSAMPQTTDCQSSLVVCHAVSARWLVVTVSVTIVTIVASSLVAWNGNVAGWERSVLEFINGWPNFLEPAFWVLQQPGVLFAPVIVGLVVVAQTRQWQHFVAFAAVLPLKLGIEKGLVKQLVERERPFVSAGEWVNVRGSAFEGLSFPSGHTTTAFATAILLFAFLPKRWRPIPIIWAAVVGVARIYYGEHNALDVVAGAALGTLFATGLWFTFLNRFAHPDCRCADR